MILVDHQIADLIASGEIANHDPNCINPASLDIRIGFELLEEIKPPLWLRLLWQWWPDVAKQLDHSAECDRWRRVDLRAYSEERPYWLQPERFILICSIEEFNLPNWIAADFKLKSSAGRMGFNHVLAGWCDPGWNGSVLTKEITNYRRWRPLAVWPGMQLGQMVFPRLAARPDRTYDETGRYNGDRSVVAAK